MTEVRRERVNDDAGKMLLDVHDGVPGQGLAVVAHGLNGAPQQPHMRTIIAALSQAGLSVVAPHLPHSAANASGNPTEGFTMEGTVGDLARVLDWLPEAGLPQPRIVAGHSMGGYAALRLAATREDVPAVLAVSPATAGRLLIDVHRVEGALERLRGEVHAALDEWPLHDLAPLAGSIAQPVALIVGEMDHLTRPVDVDELRSRLPRVVFWRILPGDPHCPVGPDYPVALSAAITALLRG